jgi:hypothetical protein
MQIRIDENGEVDMKREWTLCFNFGKVDVLVVGLNRIALQSLKKIIDGELNR